MRTALYTVVHPGITPYLRPWHESLRAQRDQNFDLWLSLDGVSREQVCATLETEVDATWCVARPGATHAALRADALGSVTRDYDAVILVDGDDVLEPSRVGAAKEALEAHDVYGCAMTLMDETGGALPGVFAPPPGADSSKLLPRLNLFGFSNTAYRSRVLADALTALPDTTLVDWWVVTRAWLQGATLTFDRRPRMAYRQYANNTARVLPPFTPAYLLTATAHVLNHYRLLEDVPENAPPESLSHLKMRHLEVQRFAAAITDRDVLARYLEALHARSQTLYLWWEMVAHPDLETLWKSST